MRTTKLLKELLKGTTLKGALSAKGENPLLGGLSLRAVTLTPL